MITNASLSLCLLALSLSLSLGCISKLEPDVGEARAGLCRPEDTDPDRNVSFKDDIMPLFERDTAGCSCHISGEGRSSGIQRSGLDLTSHETMMRGGDIGGSETVIPGDPCASTLLLKIGPAPPFGSRMPPNGPPFWTPQERSLLSDWIAEGAYDN